MRNGRGLVPCQETEELLPHGYSHGEEPRRARRRQITHGKGVAAIGTDPGLRRKFLLSSDRASKTLPFSSLSWGEKDPVVCSFQSREHLLGAGRLVLCALKCNLRLEMQLQSRSPGVVQPLTGPEVSVLWEK